MRRQGRLQRRAVASFVRTMQLLQIHVLHHLLQLFHIGHLHATHARQTRHAETGLLALLAFLTLLRGTTRIRGRRHHLLHHFARFVELLHDLVHFLNRSAGAGRDALTAAAIEQLWLFALGLRHREDDGLHAVERARIDLTLRHGLIATGQRADELRDAAHLGNLLLDFKEVVQVNVGPLNALGGFGFNLFSLNFRGVLNKRNHIAHAQNALCHAVGMERLERIGLLARADEFNRLAGDLLERQRAAATGVAVHLRHDHAVKIDLLCILGLSI